MAAPRRYRKVNPATLKWIIIDDRTSDLEKLAEELRALDVKPENIHGFKLESQANFDAPEKKNKKKIKELLDLTNGSKPAFDYLGITYAFDNEEWKKFESEVSLRFYREVLYPIISNKSDDTDISFIFLIDLDFRNKSYCGIDVLALLRKTLNPFCYQVRFITNVSRHSVKRFIDAEFGGKLAILGDNNHLSFISKDSRLREMPIITKDYYKQFTGSFVEKINKRDKDSIFGGYESSRKGKPVVYLSDRDIKIEICGREYLDSEIERIKDLTDLEGAIKKNNPTIVVVDLDLYKDPRECIWTLEGISMKKSNYEIQGFSVYFITSKPEEDRKNDKTCIALTRSRWKTFLHYVNPGLGLQVGEANVSSPIYWKFKISIDTCKQFLHDLRHAFNSPDEIYDLAKIKQEMEASLALMYNQDLDRMVKVLNDNTDSSIDNLEAPVEKILWVVVGIDHVSVDSVVTKLEAEAEVLKTHKYLNQEDQFIPIVVGDTVEDFKKQIGDLQEYENTVFLFDDLMPCYIKIIKNQKVKLIKALEIIKKEFKEKNFTYRILERTTWNFVAKTGDEWKVVEIEKEERDKGKELFKSANKCFDFFVYSRSEDESFFTVDKIFFMRSDLKMSKSVVRNPAFNELIFKIKYGKKELIPDYYRLLAKYLAGNGKIEIRPAKGYNEVSGSFVEWMNIIWGSNNGCDEMYNEAILINRLYILEFVCANFEYIYSEYWRSICLSVRLRCFKSGIISRFIGKSKLKVWNLLHQQYAFDTHQETEDGDDSLITISADSLYEYEKDYLREIFKGSKNESEINEWLYGKSQWEQWDNYHI